MIQVKIFEDNIQELNNFLTLPYVEYKDIKINFVPKTGEYFYSLIYDNLDLNRKTLEEEK